MQQISNPSETVKTQQISNPQRQSRRSRSPTPQRQSRHSRSPTPQWRCNKSPTPHPLPLYGHTHFHLYRPTHTAQLYQSYYLFVCLITSHLLLYTLLYTATPQIPLSYLHQLGPSHHHPFPCRGLLMRYLTLVIHSRVVSHYILPQIKCTNLAKSVIVYSFYSSSFHNILSHTHNRRGLYSINFSIYCCIHISV